MQFGSEKMYDECKKWDTPLSMLFSGFEKQALRSEIKKKILV